MTIIVGSTLEKHTKIARLPIDSLVGSRSWWRGVYRKLKATHSTATSSSFCHLRRAARTAHARQLLPPLAAHEAAAALTPPAADAPPVAADAGARLPPQRSRLDARDPLQARGHRRGHRRGRDAPVVRQGGRRHQAVPERVRGAERQGAFCVCALWTPSLSMLLAACCWWR